MNSQESEGLLDHAAFERIISKLPAEEAEAMRLHRKQLLESAKSASIAAIMARNLSHNIGRHSSF